MLEYQGDHSAATWEKVIEMQEKRQSKRQDSAASELVVPAIFIAGLFALMALVSSLG